MYGVVALSVLQRFGILRDSRYCKCIRIGLYIPSATGPKEVKEFRDISKDEL